jgi:hypothetical protein
MPGGLIRDCSEFISHFANYDLCAKNQKDDEVYDVRLPLVASQR